MIVVTNVSVRRQRYLDGFCGVEFRNASKFSTGRSGAFFRRRLLRAAILSRQLIVRIGQCVGQHFMAGISHSAQIDLRFADLAREVLGFGVSVGPGDLAPAFPPPLTMPEWNKREG